MRVLHLPSNIASQANILVEALRQAGVDARGLVIDPAPIQSAGSLEIYRRAGNWRRSWRGWLQTLRWWSAVLAAVRWADVVHWHLHLHTFPKDLALRYIAALNKPRLVQFHGSDIRMPEVAQRDNPYLARFMASNTNTAFVSYGSSRRTQEKFSRYGFACLIPGVELLDYVQGDLFPTPFRTEAVIDVSQFDVCYPDPARQVPIVVHTPSNIGVKGTDSVLRAIEQLKPHYNFEFRLIHNLPRAEALALMRECDIMLDQFVLGAFGVSALEAMAFGKLTVCYLNPSVVQRLPADCPIVNAAPDNLAQVLAELLTHRQQWAEIGQRSRRYVEQHHASRQIARQLIPIYQTLIDRQSGKR